MTVRSELDVFVYTRDIVMQNSTFFANVTVTDSLGSRVPDATVLVSLDGTDYPVTYGTAQYHLSIPNIDLEPGEYLANATVNHAYAESQTTSSSQFRIETDQLLFANSIPSEIEQDADLIGWLNITDLFGNPIVGALIEIISTGYEYELQEIIPGSYLLNSSAEMSVGNHSFTIFIDHDFLQKSSFTGFDIAVTGELSVEVPELPPVRGGTSFNVSVFISDNYGSAPSDTWVMIEIDGENVTAIRSSGGTFRASLNATYPMGLWKLTVYYGSSYSTTGELEYDLIVLSNPIIEITPSDNWTVEQAENTTITVQVEDWLYTAILDASVTIDIRGTTYTLTHIGDGLYWEEIPTLGWPHGPHPYYLTVDHEYLNQTQRSDYITVIAKPSITIIPSSLNPEQYDTLIVTLEVTDLYDIPISELELTVSFANMTERADETDITGTYTVSFEIGDIHHGWYDIDVNLIGNNSISWEDDMEIFVEVYIQGVDTLGLEVYSIAGVLSLLVSLIGMILFVKVSSVISTKPRQEDDVTSSINQLDRIYVVIVAISAVVFIHSWNLYTTGAYEYAMVESLILLGSSVLMYGIWLYRDAYSSILLKRSFDKKRAALGMWHLFLVPFIILLIFEYGRWIELFQRFILEVPQIVVGEISIPPLQATVLGTYMSSIVVVVASFYREIRKGLKRIDDMVIAGTPSKVVDEEQALLIGRTGSSIRIKFLMFLMILGATTVMQLDFLRQYSMAAIVLIPIVFLVLIPFISSRLVKGFPKVVGRIRGTDEGYSETESVDVE
ncbi:MAG: hypothetical protein ACXAEF_10230 [Candidatus Thorarchaeota archaeon]